MESWMEKAKIQNTLKFINSLIFWYPIIGEIFVWTPKIEIALLRE